MSRLISVLLITLPVGCSTKDPTMPTNQRWVNLHAVIGWTVQAEDGPDSVKDAHLKRHPRHCSYISHAEVKPLNESEADRYGILNEKMHEQLRRVTKEHFAGTPAPPGVDPTDWLAEYFTPFTYQNYDWYGPTYECYIGVRTDYISTELLRKFQLLLTGEFRDWCIQVVASETPDFGNDFEIAVFFGSGHCPVQCCARLRNSHGRAIASRRHNRAVHPRGGLGGF